jgi:hypothetical protein
MAVPSPFKHRYVFTLSAPVTAMPVGETPTGYRVDIEYQTPGKVETRPVDYYDSWVGTLNTTDFDALLVAINNSTVDTLKGNPTGASETQKETIAKAIFQMRQPPPPPPGQPVPAQPPAAVAAPGPPSAFATIGWYGLDALLLSGSDWAIIRSDGVAEFNGRLILRSKDADGGLVSVAAGGPVDFVAVLGLPNITTVVSSPSQGLQAVLNKLQTGVPPAAVLIAATFDASGDAQPWAPPRMKREAKDFWKYAVLTRGQFVAVGTATLGKNVSSPITAVEYDFYRCAP